MSDPHRSYSFRQFQHDADHLFNHLLDLRREPSPIQLERFHNLFLEGTAYPEAEVLASLHTLASSNWADTEFSSILNRCCYILINYWWVQPDFKQFTLELVDLLQPPYPAIIGCKAAQRVQDLVCAFTQTEQYAVLQDRARIVDSSPTPQRSPQAEPVRNFLARYPFLYPHCLLNCDSSESGQDAVRHMQETRERQFEQSLNRYIRSLLKGSRHVDENGSAIAVENPTLLSPQKLEAAVRKFVGKAEGGKTYYEQARQFTAYSQGTASYRDLKHQIYEYLTDSIQYSDNPGYGKHHFNRWLEERLEDTFPQNDHLRPNNFLLLQTCAQLVEYLVASPKNRPADHGMFIDMNSNLGATFTIGLLLKIVLICCHMKTNLEVMKTHLSKRFAVVLKHYEAKVSSELEWLIECLENLMVAFSTHFGRADFSWVNLV